MASQAIVFDENSNAASAGTLTTPLATSQMPAAVAAAAATPSTAIVSQFLNVKDSRWLQVEACRQFQRGQCTRGDQECKFAHPPQHVDVLQGRVTACYDSIKGRCTRENLKCKYLHPPQHIKDQLLINGRNNLALKNLFTAQLNSGAGQPIVNPLQHIQLLQQQGITAVIPTLPYPYHQHMMYPAMLQADPYQVVNQQLQAAALLQPGLQLQQPGILVGQQFAAVASPANSLATLAFRKRTLAPSEDDGSTTTSQPVLNMTAADVPCKRPSVDNNGTMIYGAAAAQPGAQDFNPYLIQGYVTPVTFASQSQLPPRY